ncbi:transglutaminase family protein [Leifsonella bigeumensis]|uniref:transglutaminase family protein n=1 Tax=Leifsonella bigeumensis TaxID=433643 RepID=UPI0031D0F0DD
MTERRNTTSSGGMRRELPRVLVLLLAFAVTFGGLHTILEGGAWLVLCLVLAVLVFGGGLAVRTLLRGHPVVARIAGPLAGAMLAAAAIVIRFASDAALLGFIPTAAVVDRFRHLIRDAGYSITWQNVPATADEPISFLLAAGATALLLAAEIFAFSLRLPALAGLPLAAIFLVPGMTPEGTTDGWLFAASALAYLALLLVGRAQVGRAGQLVPTVAIGVAAVLSGLVLPGALPSTDLTATSSGLGPTVSTGVNPMLRLGDDLRSTDIHVALTYSTVSGRGEYLRLVEVSDFFSSDWGPSQPSLDSQNRPVDFPRPPGLAVGVTTENEVTYVYVANLVSPWLPVPYPASSITGLDGSWQYLPESFTVASNLSLARGEDYTVSSVVLTPTPDQLLAAGSRVPDGFGEYLSLPPDTPGIIAATAREVTAGESSNYERALALQEYLRSAPFQYSESAPVTDGYDGTGVDVVAAFLEQHRGYCIHFASAMAVMARELGIPSRIIVGFQPGALQNGSDRGRRLFEVTTKDLHAWPELYFAGIGWVRFEPTPSRGNIPDYANATTPGVPVVQGPPAVPSNPESGLDDGSAPQIDQGPTVVRWLSSGQLSSWLAIGGVVVLLFGIVFLPAGLRWMRRRRRLAALRAGRGTAASAWHEVMESAEDIGVTVSRTLTPREAVARLHRVRGMSDAGREALDRIGRAIEREGYGRPTRDGTAGYGESRVIDVRSGLADDLAIVLRCLKAGADGNDRLRATMLPPSLVSRTVKLVGRLA